MNFLYILKVDDDSFVRFDFIVFEFKSIYFVRKLYWGFFCGDVYVKFVGLWFEKNWYFCDRYLSYV